MKSILQPVTFYVPTSADEPVEVKVTHSGLRMALVNRSSIRLLGDEWKMHGIYFLLGPAENDPDRFRAYVGEVGRRDFLTRLTEHVAQKPWWSRALLVASDSPDGFNSAEIGWLEGRFYDVLNNAIAAEIMSKGRPGDDSIALKDRGVLERYVEPVMAALRACGAPPDTVDQKPLPKGTKRAFYRESVKDLIEAGLLKTDTRLQPLRKNLTTTALVLPDGNLEVDGVSYGSVSAAAVAVSHSKSEPGWEFWGAPSGDGGHVSLFALRERLQSDPRVKTTSPAPAANAKSPDTRSSNSGLPVVSAKGSKRHFGISVKDLLDAGLLTAGEELVTTRRGRDDRATVQTDGSIRVGSETYSSLSTAAKTVSGTTSEPGWEYWAVTRDGRRVALFDVRNELTGRRGPVRPTGEG